MSRLNIGGNTSLVLPHGSVEVSSHTRNGLHYLQWGEGKTTVLAIHKVSGGAETLIEPLHSLSEKAALTVLAPDLRGHGYSFAPAHGYQLCEHIKDMFALVEKRQDAPFFLLGHSLGARIAIRFAVDYPHLVKGVIAVEPPLCGPGKAEYPYTLESAIDWRNNVMKQGVRYCLESNSRYSIAQAKLRVTYGIKCGENVLRETWEEFNRVTMDTYLQQLTVPTLLLRGEHGVISPAEAKHVQALNAHIKANTLAGAGHNPPWDTPEPFLAQCLSFIQQYR